MRIFLDECDYLIHLIRCAIHNEQPQELPDALNFERVYEYGEYHHIANIAFYSVKRLNTKPNADLYQKWEECCNRAVIRDINQSYARDEIVAQFQKSNIRWLEVQGTRIKTLYPQPEYRTMTDLDFIIDLENLPSAKALLEDLGYQCQFEQEVDVGATRPPNIRIELHTGYFYSNYPYHDIMPPPFSSVDSSGECGVSDFYLYNLLHIMKHYFSGGCGIRRVLDLYYLSSNFIDTIDKAYVQAALERAQVADLVAEMQTLAHNWFGNGEWSTFRSDMESYIIKSGMHGNEFNYIRNRVNESFDSTGRFPKGRHFLKRLLGTKENMYTNYPVLKRYKFLYPVCWVHRGFSALHPSKRNFIKTEIKLIIEKESPKS